MAIVRLNVPVSVVLTVKVCWPPPGTVVETSLSTFAGKSSAIVSAGAVAAPATFAKA